jgi:hypothetical protein
MAGVGSVDVNVVVFVLFISVLVFSAVVSTSVQCKII